jgi:phenylacetic acid degradation protein paaN
VPQLVGQQPGPPVVEQPSALVPLSQVATVRSRSAPAIVPACRPAGGESTLLPRPVPLGHDVGMTETPHPLYAAHAETLTRALDAIIHRGYWSAHAESPSPRVYGETAAAEGEAAFRAYLGGDFPLDQPGTGDRVATEVSPYGIALDVRYPHAEPDALVAAATAALPAWRDAGPQARAGVCLEILHRLHQHVFELANAVQYTTGQAFVMAFQAGGAHALDRALEAIAYAYAEMTRHPATADWEKPAGRGEPLRMTKTFHVVPRGVALVIGCNTFPTWNSWPGLFASLVTGNPVVVKPHPRAVLPLAITVRYAREVLAEAGFDPDLVLLAAEAPGEKLASDLALHPAVKIVDFTGSTEYGDWLETHARQAAVFTEKAGVNTVVVDSTDDFAGMCRNIAFSLTLYSGQMCTTPQNILVPTAGIDTDQGHKSVAEVAAGLAEAVDKLTADPARAVAVTGAIVNEPVLARLAEAARVGEVVLPSREVTDPAHPDAVVRTPMIVRLGADAAAVYGREWFGPVSFVVETDSTEHSLEIFRKTVAARGALTASVYATDPKVLDAAEQAAVDAGVHLSCNLTGGVFVNQSAAFSDFHASGANPAANSALTDGAYVASRFRIVQSRRHS